MKDEDYIRYMQEHQEEMRKYKLTRAILLLGMGICLCLLLIQFVI